MKAEWRPVPGYEGSYEVSNGGDVRSIRRVIMRKNGVPQTINEMILWATITENGYLSVNLRLPGSNRAFYIHRLVALAFIPNPNKKPHVHHKDRERKNNSSINLEWVTVSENIKHTYAVPDRKKGGARGEECNFAKLTESKVIEIRGSKEMTSALAARYGVSKSLIGQVRSRSLWRHVA